MSVYRETENLPFTRLPFWIRNGKFIVISTIAIINLGAFGAFAYVQAKKPPPPAVKECQEVSDMRTRDEGEFKCPPDTKMALWWGAGTIIHEGDYLVRCECK
jgi:hypothetical protein